MILVFEPRCKIVICCMVVSSEKAEQSTANVLIPIENFLLTSKSLLSRTLISLQVYSSRLAEYSVALSLFEFADTSAMPTG